MAESLAYRIGKVAWDTSPDMVDSHCLTSSPMKTQLIEEWGRQIIAKLIAQGIYLNPGRNDPSGRW